MHLTSLKTNLYELYKQIVDSHTYKKEQTVDIYPNMNASQKHSGQKEPDIKRVLCFHLYEVLEKINQ